MGEGEGIIDKETLKKGVKDASALISILSTNVDKEVIDSGENLKIIANYGAGFNNVDVDYAREKNIDVTNTPKASTAATAELTFGLVLAIALVSLKVTNFLVQKDLMVGRHYSLEAVKSQAKHLVLSDLE